MQATLQLDPVQRFTIEDCYNHPAFQKEREEYEQRIKENPLLAPQPKSKSSHKSAKHRDSDMKYLKTINNTKQDLSNESLTPSDADSSYYKKATDQEKVKVKPLVKSTDSMEDTRRYVDNSDQNTEPQFSDYSTFDNESPRERNSKNEEKYPDVGSVKMNSHNGCDTNSRPDIVDVKSCTADVSSHPKQGKTGPIAYSHFVAANYNFFPGANQQTKVFIFTTITLMCVTESILSIHVSMVQSYLLFII